MHIIANVPFKSNCKRYLIGLLALGASLAGRQGRPAVAGTCVSSEIRKQLLKT